MNIGNVIADGMPVIVKGEPDTEYALPSTTEECTYDGANLLVANGAGMLRYLPETENDKTNYYFDGTQFVKSTGGETIHEKQAYLNVASNVETIILSEEVTPTGVSAIQISEFKIQNCYYDLQGRVVKNPRKGIYIYDGKKIVIN